jgi:hypothetical protein
MMNELLGLAGFAFVGSITPGPNNSLLLASGTRFGFGRTVPHVAGTAVGMGVLVLAVAGGVGVVLAAVPGAELALKAAGSAYLLYLAFRIASSRGGGGGTVVARPLGVLNGAAFQFANPKAWLFAVAAVGTFLPPAWRRWPRGWRSRPPARWWSWRPRRSGPLAAPPCAASRAAGPSGRSTSRWRWSSPRRSPSSGPSGRRGWPHGRVRRRR